MTGQTARSGRKYAHNPTSNPARAIFHHHRPGAKCLRCEPAPCTACGWGLCLDCFGKFCGCATRGHR